MIPDNRSLNVPSHLDLLLSPRESCYESTTWYVEKKKLSCIWLWLPSFLIKFCGFNINSPGLERVALLVCLFSRQANVAGHLSHPVPCNLWGFYQILSNLTSPPRGHRSYGPGWAVQHFLIHLESTAKSSLSLAFHFIAPEAKNINIKKANGLVNGFERWEMRGTLGVISKLLKAGQYFDLYVYIHVYTHH